MCDGNSDHIGRRDVGKSVGRYDEFGFMMENVAYCGIAWCGLSIPGMATMQKLMESLTYGTWHRGTKETRFRTVCYTSMPFQIPMSYERRRNDKVINQAVSSPLSSHASVNPQALLNLFPSSKLLQHHVPIHTKHGRGESRTRSSPFPEHPMVRPTSLLAQHRHHTHQQPRIQSQY